MWLICKTICWNFRHWNAYHTGDKPYLYRREIVYKVCEYCRKSFTQSSSSTRHVYPFSWLNTSVFIQERNHVNIMGKHYCSSNQTRQLYSSTVIGEQRWYVNETLLFSFVFFNSGKGEKIVLWGHVSWLAIYNTNVYYRQRLRLNLDLYVMSRMYIG